MSGGIVGGSPSERRQLNEAYGYGRNESVHSSP